MGQRGNKRRAQSRRSIEAAAKAAALLRKAENENGIETLDQEKLEMERAYATAEADGEFKEDTVDLEGNPIGHTSIVPWELLEEEIALAEDDDHVVSLLEKFLVLVEADHKYEYPELNLMIFVNGDHAEEAEFAEMFARSGCQRAASLDEADLCVFVGGADVDPQLYGHVRWANTSIHPPQDGRDLEVYAYCQSYGIPMVGVCRGAQFLHVMNGGKLFQDVDKHVGDHAISIIQDNAFIQKTPSVHHQLCMPNPHRKMQVLATAAMARNRRWWDEKAKDFVNTIGPKADIEAFFYRETCCLGFQGHPEYANYPEYTTWCLKKIEELIRHNSDLEYSDDGAVMRIKPELLKGRLTDLMREEELAKIEAEDDAELNENEVEVN